MSSVKVKVKVVDQFREHGVFNPHNFVSKFGKRGVDDYVISYSPPGRASAAKSLVWSPNRKVAPKGHWQDYGAQSFIGAKRSSRPEAITWATEHLKLADWVPCPADPNALVPKAVRDRGLAWLRRNSEG